MKRKTSNIISIIEMTINLALLPLFHLKMFHEVSVVPGMDAEGNMVTFRSDHYYSIVDNLKYDPIGWIWISIALIGISVLYSFLSFFIKNKNMKVASHIFAICSIGFFLLVLFLASLVRRDY